MDKKLELDELITKQQVGMTAVCFESYVLNHEMF